MTAVSSSLPPNIRSYVGDFVVAARKAAARRAVGRAGAVFVGWGLACCAADRLLQLPEWCRAGLLGVGLVAVVAIVLRPMASLLRRRRDWAGAAAEVERHDPRFGQRLVTVTTRLLGPPEHRGSDDMLYRLLSDVDREVSARRPRRVAARAAATLPWVALALLLALAAVLTRVETFNLPRLALRFVAPLADVEPVTTTRIRLAPGDTTLVQSQPLRVDVTAERLPPNGVVWLTWREGDGPWVRRVMNREAATAAGGTAGAGTTTARFSLTLPAVDRDLRYRVLGGDYRSREHTVQVLRPPAVAGFHIRYFYPPFTGRPPFSVTNTDGLIEAPAGTEATLAVTATEPLQSALLRIGDTKILMTRGPADPPHVRRATFKVDRTGPYELDLISTREVAGGGPPGLFVRALADRRPIVRLLQSGQGLRLNPRAILPLSYQALDDFGIDWAAVRAQVAGGPTVDKPVAREGDARRQEGTFHFDLADIKLAVGDVLTLSLVARDRAGQQETSESLQVLVAPASVDLETHQRITELEAAAQLAGLVAEELEATVKAVDESHAKRGGNGNPEEAVAAAARGNRFLNTATDTAVLVRQSALRATVRSRPADLAVALANAADAAHALTAGGSEVFRGNGISDGPRDAVRDRLSKLLERARATREQLNAIAQGERAAAILLERENLAASERRAAAEPQAAERLRQTLQRAREDVAAGVKGLGLDPAAGNLDDLLRAKVAAQAAVLKAQQPIDFAAAAREWSQELQRDPLRRLPLEDRLALAAQAEAVRPGADLARARDLHLCARAASRVLSDAAADKYAGRPVQPGAANQFASAVAALQREHELNRRTDARPAAARPADSQPAATQPAGAQPAATQPAAARPPDETTDVRQAAAEARKLVAHLAGEATPPPTGPAVAGEPRPRSRRAEDLALRGSADLAGRDYAAARAADRDLLRQLAGATTPAAGDDPAATVPATTAVAGADTQPAVAGYLRRDLDRVEHLTDRAETIDRVQSDQDAIARETQTVDTGAASQAPVLADRQLDVAQRIAEVTAHEDPTAAVDPASAAAFDRAEDPNWRGRATAAVVRAQEQLAAMPQHLTRAREEAASLRQAAERVEMARREAAAAPPEQKSALERAARQAEQERKEAEKRLRNAALPVLPSTVEALAVRLAPFEPESTAAREVMRRELALALQAFEEAALGGDSAAADRAAAAARAAIEAAQQELARAQDVFTERDPLIAAKWFARAAADSLTRSPPDLQSAYRRQMDTSQALSRAWDRTVHEAAAQRLSLVPSMQSLYGVPVPAPVLTARGRRGADREAAADAVSDIASVREWGRLRPREVEELNAPIRESEAPGYERALQLYFETLSKGPGEVK